MGLYFLRKTHLIRQNNYASLTMIIRIDSSGVQAKKENFTHQLFS